MGSGVSDWNDREDILWRFMVLMMVDRNYWDVSLVTWNVVVSDHLFMVILVNTRVHFIAIKLMGRVVLPMRLNVS